jgi:prolyl oligopeptidase
MESGGPDLEAYLRAQNSYTRSTLDALPARAALLSALKTSIAAAGQTGRIDLVTSAAGRLFFTRLTDAGGYHALFVREGDRERLLFDPNAAKTPGEILVLSPSPDGRHVAFGVASGGSERSLIHVIEVESGADRVENVTPFVTYALNWRDDTSFYYVRTNELTDQRLNLTLLHRLGTSIDRDDALISGDTLHNALWRPHQTTVITAVPPRWAIAEVDEGTDTEDEEVFVAPLASATSGSAPWRKIAGPDDLISTVAATGDTLYGLTSKGAPYRAVVSTTLARPSPLHVVLPEGKTLLTAITAYRGSFVLTDRDGTSSRARIVDAALHARTLPLPTLNTISIATTYERDAALLVDGATFNDPRRIYAVDPVRMSVSDTGLTPAAPAYYRSIQVTNTTAKSADGTMVPLTILSTDRTPRDGSAPTVLLGYGSYGLDPYEPPIPPAYFGIANSGVVLAVAHVRGGGELGPAWHEAGKGPNKYHTIDDFLACAHQLIADGWTKPSRLAALGGSAGGITVGRAMTREPGLFAAVVSEVGVSDTLRFEQTPNGKGNIPEFGTIANEAGFHALFEMSPYAHVIDGTAYPAFMMTTGLNDPRVAPWQVAKMEARVQAASTSGKPVLLRVDEAAGHGIGDSLDAQLAEAADEYAFILWQEGAEPLSPPGS